MTAHRLVFLVHKGKDYTLKHYFKVWGQAVADRIAVKVYPGVGNTGRTPRKRLERRLRAWRTGVLRPEREPVAESVYVFTDLEMLAPWETEVVTGLAAELERRGARAILNHPARALTRSELLVALAEAGINSFRAYPAAGEPTPSRWPVFVRNDRSHDDDSLSALLSSPAELDRALAAIGARSSYSVVEYAGKPDPDGLYRKYAAIKLGGEIVPCHIFFGHEWAVKHSEVVSEETAAEELAYIETNPHRETLERVFEIAKIGYGRVDYGVVDGRPEIWEINTNPYVIRPEYTRQEARRPALMAFAERLNRAIEEITRG